MVSSGDAGVQGAGAHLSLPASCGTGFQGSRNMMEKISSCSSPIAGVFSNAIEMLQMSSWLLSQEETGRTSLSAWGYGPANILGDWWQIKGAMGKELP